jgi:hypothetical protein
MSGNRDNNNRPSKSSNHPSNFDDHGSYQDRQYPSLPSSFHMSLLNRLQTAMVLLLALILPVQGQLESAWLIGSNQINQTANYGLKGVASSSSFPGSRSGHAMAMDSTRKLIYMFGGIGHIAEAFGLCFFFTIIVSKPFRAFE